MARVRSLAWQPLHAAGTAKNKQTTRNPQGSPNFQTQKQKTSLSPTSPLATVSPDGGSGETYGPLTGQKCSFTDLSSSAAVFYLPAQLSDVTLHHFIDSVFKCTWNHASPWGQAATIGLCYRPSCLTGAQAQISPVAFPLMRLPASLPLALNSNIYLLSEAFPNCPVEHCRRSRCGSGVTNLTRNHEVAGLIPGLTQWVKDPALP